MSEEEQCRVTGVVVVHVHCAIVKEDQRFHRTESARPLSLIRLFRVQVEVRSSLIGVTYRVLVLSLARVPQKTLWLFGASRSASVTYNHSVI